MALLPITLIFFIALVIFFSVYKDSNKRRVKKKKRMNINLRVILLVYFILLLIPTIWGLRMSSITNSEFKTISKEEYEKIAVVDGFSVSNIKEDVTIEFGEGKNFNVDSNSISVEADPNYGFCVVVVEKEDLNNEIRVTPFKKRNAVVSNGDFYDISKVIPFDKYKFEDNKIALEKMSLKTKVYISESSYGIEGINQLRGLFIEVPKGMDVKGEMGTVIMR